MSAQYYMIVRNAAGAEQKLIGDHLSLVYTRLRNGADRAVFTLRDGHPALASLVDKAILEVHRAVPEYGITDYTDFVGLVRRPDDFAVDADGRTVATIVADDIAAMLRWRHIAWYKGVADRSEFTSVKGETILKNLVKYNAGAQALASNGRIRDAVITGLTVETDLARGNTKSWTCAPEDNLLDTLQKLVSAGAGGDFAVVQSSPAVFDFRFYPGQLGTDRTASVVFSIANGNMAEPHYVVDHSEEKTVAIVLGEGDGEDRVVVVRTSSAFNSSTNNIETAINASSYKTVLALEAVGDGELYNKRATTEMTFKPLQTTSSAYGKHYFLGDLVTADFRGVTTTHIVNRVTISHEENGAEDVQVECVAV